MRRAGRNALAEVFDQDFDADADQDQAAEDFGFRAEPRRNAFADLQSGGRDQESRQADQQRREQGVAQRRSVEQPDLDHPEAESGDQRVDAERHAEQQRIA